MENLRLQVAGDHLERLGRTQPQRGLLELVWNSLDADAKRVDMSVLLNPLKGVDEVMVTDDGVGITPPDAREYFGSLGASWKRARRDTPGEGRMVHGERGEGRFRAFALGDSVEWSSVAAVDGVRRSLRIGIRAEDRVLAHVEDLGVTDAPTGTSVKIRNRGDARLVSLQDTDAVVLRLVADLAPYLEAYPQVVVSFEGRRIDPSAVRDRLEERPIEAEGVRATLRIIEWTQEVERALLLTDERGFVVERYEARIHAPGYRFTAYVKPHEPLVEGATMVGEMHPIIGPLLDTARSEMRDYFRTRREELGREVVESWKEEKSYPYRGEAAGTVEAAERRLFEVVALTVNDRLPDLRASSRESRRLTLRLLRAAIERGPAQLRAILAQVLDLDEDTQQILARLLERTSLSRLVEASAVVADRVDFLNGLELLLFEPESNKRLLERSQLHRILASETWIFGEEFHLTVDDESLETALDRHIGLLGRERLAPEPVVVPDKTSAILDMMLSRTIEDRDGWHEHLVVELKRPSKKAAEPELNQIKRYARAVANDPQFDKARTRWSFWLLVNDIDDFVRDEARQDARPSGLAWQGTGELAETRVWVKTWSEVIHSAKQRLGFYRERLGVAGGRADAVKYLDREHAQHLPPVPELRERLENDLAGE